METRHAPGKTGGPGRKDTTQAAQEAAPLPYAGKPLDGSQYHDVIEEQEYAEQRPTPEEQKPRYSYLHKQDQRRDKK